MRLIKRCKTCKGVYFSHDEAGLDYYHACPPLSDPEFAALPPTEKAGKGPGSPRGNARDENFVFDERGRVVRRKADGPGADVI